MKCGGLQCGVNQSICMNKKKILKFSLLNIHINDFLKSNIHTNDITLRMKILKYYFCMDIQEIFKLAKSNYHNHNLATILELVLLFSQVYCN